MEKNIKEKVIAWAESGGDFSAGLSLLMTWNRNMFFMRNIQVKGAERGTLKLVCQFSLKTKLPMKEIREMIERGKKGINRNTVETVEISRNTVELNRNTVETGREIEHKKRTTKLREEFPFLGRKDCPEELMILVNKMLTAYDDYRTGHDGLFDINVNNLTECYKGSKEVLEAYILNREIWEELNYYKLHGKILGNLSEFKIRKMGEKYRAMGTVALMKVLGNNLPRKMSYYKKQLNDPAIKNPEDIRDMMAEAEREIAMIKEILKERGEL